MVRRLFNKCLLRPEDLSPSRDNLEVVSVFNPGAIALGDEVVLIVRVAERPRERRPGFIGLPRWDTAKGEIAIDWVAEEDVEMLDPRVVRRKRDGLVRLTFTSHLRVVRSKDGRAVDSVEERRFEPREEFEEFGVEDPRITRLGETYYMTYVAVSRHGAATALASTRDFETFKRHGVIFYPENKDVVLFPELFGGEYFALHRPNAATPFCTPEIWCARSRDLVNWGRHRFFLGGMSGWETGRIGAGTPPVRTPRGWLEIYHGNRLAPGEKGVGTYAAGALLLDLDDPSRIVAASSEPILEPQADFEREGFVPDVVFPTGVVERGETLLVYYGAADRAVGLVELSLDELLATLRPVGRVG